MTYNVGSLIKETTTTTGTGDITLAGAAIGFETFAANMSTGSFRYVPYIIRSDTEYEIGMGRLSASNTLQRVAVFESSNANALVNFAAGIKDVYCAGGAYNPSGVRNNWTATAPPVNATNNKTQGYGPGSIWVDNWNEAVWMAHITDGLNNNVSWYRIGTSRLNTLATSGGVFTNILSINSAANIIPSDASLSNDAVIIGGQSHELAKEGANHLYSNSVLFGTSGLCKWRNTIVHAVDHSGQAVAGVHQNMRRIYGARTTNATQTQLSAGSPSFSHLRIPNNAIMHIKAVGAAKQNAASEYKTVTFEATLFNNAGTVSIIGSPTWTTVNQSAGASAWLFECLVSSDYAWFWVTGVAATTINWTMSLEATLVTDSAA